MTDRERSTHHVDHVDVGVSDRSAPTQLLLREVARGEAHLTIYVERNDQNRVLNWEVDSRNYYRSSTAQLDGAESPRSWVFSLKDLAPGTYQVRATVRRSNNSESVALTQMRVVGVN